MTSTNKLVQQDQLRLTKTLPEADQGYSQDPPLLAISAILSNRIDHPETINKDCIDDDIIANEPGTPTSPARRLRPEIGPCPPAPRKPKSLPIKRKWSPDQSRTSANRLLDFSKEVESMYPPLLQANLGRKIKKARSV